MPWFAKYNADRRLMNAAGNEGAEGGGGAATAEGGEAPVEAPVEAPAAEGGEAPEGDKPTDREAKLLKETMQRKERIKELESQLQAFGDVTPDKIKALLDAETARQAEEANREKADLEARGEFDRLKEMMAAEHQATLSAKDQELNELRELNASLVKNIEEMTVGSDFSNSKFIADELLLTPAKARVIYGQHFEVKDGKVIGYDKPVGAKDRTALVGGDGNPLSFDVALRKLVEADPDRDSLIRAKAKPGAGSAQPEAGAPEKTVASGVSRISVGLASLNSD